jgi:bifunctional enzyme CysN/CysC
MAAPGTVADSAHTGLLRFITCGSVDDGKSTLIGRLLHDTGGILSDQQSALVKDSSRWGTQGDEVDYALLLDGLAAEREQGITIDVAYRYFATAARKFIVADTPGHEQYTRNMVTGASSADAAVILLDARKGLMTQTRRHSLICRLMGVQHVALAVNKMDLVGYSQVRFDEISAAYQAFAQQLGLGAVTAIPLSALQGEQLVHAGKRMPWYSGPTLLQWLETVDLGGERNAPDAPELPLRMAVQWVNRPHAHFRGYTGRIASGIVKPGDEVVVLPSGRKSRIGRIVGFQQNDAPQAQAGESVTLTLADELGVSRGDVIAAAHQPPPVAQRFECHLVWLGDEPLALARQYLIKTGAVTVPGAVTQLRHRVDVNTQQAVDAATLTLNDVGLCALELDRAIVFEPYERSRELGGFIMIDRLSNQTVAAGMLRAALDVAPHVRWQGQQVSRAERQLLTGHRSAALWFTGLSGAGKSTIANLVAQRLHAAGVLTYVLDGDNIRHGLSRGLGFSDADRAENIRRAAAVAKLMVDAGVLVISAFISPFRAERQLARELFAPGDFLEVHVDAPLAVAESRDPKGLYRLARAGALKNFTGIDSAYEAPEAPELRLDTAALTAEACAEALYDFLVSRGLLEPPRPT